MVSLPHGSRIKVATLGLALLLASSPAIAGYVIQYDVYPGFGSIRISSTPQSLLITDVFDLYSEARWEIDPDSRGITTAMTDDWDWRNDGGRIEFQIVSTDANPNIESVKVDSWGAFELAATGEEHAPMTSLCCGSDVSLRTPFGSLYGSVHGGSEERWAADGMFFGSYDLLTYTTYVINYSVLMGVEVVRYPDFVSQDALDSFISTYGYSGTSYHGVQGFLQFGMVVQDVPEPKTLALLGLGLVGMGYARRRKAA